MAQYIDKSALVAEIERRIEAHKETLKNCDSSISKMVLKGSMSAYLNLLHFIDTLEVKEIDLEKEINKYISNNFFGSETMGFFANRTKEEPNDQDIALCAQNFFELGMSVSNKAQKGE